MQENFRPLAFTPPTSFLGRLKFYCRLILDLQVATIYHGIKRPAQNLVGNILDIGCGASPYKSLLNPQKTQYCGLDIVDADKFDYRNVDVTSFNGQDIPFGNETFDGVLCTEVLEHAPHYQTLVDEMHRVMKTGSMAIVTVPWSARFHYIPHDYFRYTPSALQIMFKDFKEVNIVSRGTDVTSIVAKIIVIWFRNLVPQNGKMHSINPINLFGFIASVLFTPLIMLLVCIAHFSILAKIGSADDPLGYTVFAIK